MPDKLPDRSTDETLLRGSGMNQEDKVDIAQLILDDHHEQRRLFAILEQIDPADTASLQAVWKRLTDHMEAHVEGEEQIVYPALLLLGKAAAISSDTEEETEDAIKDHNEIRDALAAVSRTPIGTEDWYKAVRAVNKANSEHMGEEEREGLTDFRRHGSLQLRHDLAVAFAAYETGHSTGVATVDKDPKTYIKEHE